MSSSDIPYPGDLVRYTMGGAPGVPKFNELAIWIGSNETAMIGVTCTFVSAI